MCGIAGIVQRDGVDRVTLERMRDSMSYRGPDNAGVWISEDKCVGLAHRRLSIIDVDPRSNQPFASCDKMIWMTFNGEIYNYKELASELQQDTPFRTKSDTEIVLHAYMKWGIEETLKKLRGFFAFGLYDSTTRKLFLVRDRFGKKPLHYHSAGGMFAFSSEAHALRALAPMKVNDESVYDFLTVGAAFPPSTFFVGVNKLPGGYFLTYDVDSGNASVSSYYNIADTLNGEVQSHLSIDEEDELLEAAARYRMVADVPVALAVSGGLDSSLNAYYCQHHRPLCVTMSWSGANEHDETAMARRVCSAFKLELRELKITPASFAEAASAYVAAQQDAPIGDINSVQVFMLARELHAMKYKVALVGEGGDELGGYPVYLDAYRNEWLHRFGAGIVLSPFVGLHAKTRDFLDYKFNGEVLPTHNLIAFREHQKRSAWLMSSSFNTYAKLNQLMREIDGGESGFDRYLRKVSNIEYKFRLPELILARLDYPSMATSVEIRSPFMDHVLIERNASVSWGAKMANRQPKAILREVAARHLPAEVLAHKKTGFTHVVNPYFKQELPAVFQKEVVRSNSPLKEYLRLDFLTWAGENLRNENLWRLYALHSWLSKVS